MKISILYAKAGFGHKRAAESVLEELLRQGLSRHEVGITDALNHSSYPFGKLYPFAYYMLVRHASWLWHLFYEATDRRGIYRLVRPFRRGINFLASLPLVPSLIESNPPVIVSTHFYSSEVAAWLRWRKKIASKVFTVITDFAVHSFWVNPGTDLYFVMAESTREGLRRWGVPDERIRVTGIPVSFKFHNGSDRRFLRSALGLEENLFTILLTSGSFGMGPIPKILERLEELQGRIQVVVVCGKNRRLFRFLKSRGTPLRSSFFGFVKNMHDLMHASDVCVSRPSGLTTSETLVVGLPMIIYELIPGQESRNARFLLNQNACWLALSPRRVAQLIQHLMEHKEELERVREKLRSIGRPEAAREIALQVKKSLS